MSRAQSIVYRGDRILMVKHRNTCEEWWCLPGGGFLENEAPEAAAIRELREECCVDGAIIRATSVVSYGADDNHYTFLVDIGEQEAKLGHDPEYSGSEPKLVAVRWMTLAQLPERDRAYLWGAGLLSVQLFAELVESWGADCSYPTSPSSAEDEPKRGDASTSDPSVRVRAGIAIVEKGRLLLVPHYDTDVGAVQWVIPGGAVRPGEHLIAAAVRECEEETGLVAEVIGLLDVSEVIDSESRYHSVSITYSGTVAGGRLRAEPDHPRGQKLPKWMSKPEIATVAVHPRSAVEKAMRLL